MCEEMTVQLSHLVESFLESSHPRKSLLTNHQIDMRMHLLDLIWVPVIPALGYMILDVKIVYNLGDLFIKKNHVLALAE